jgi:hypothetical protein
MSKDNFTASLMAVAVVSVIVASIYFNSPDLNKGSSAQQQIERFCFSKKYSTTKQYYNKLSLTRPSSRILTNHNSEKRPNLLKLAVT